jgi:ATP-dependent DNA ligase
MLAKPVASLEKLPPNEYLFEGKWDGFRSIVFRDGDEVVLGSRNEKPLTRYFPELVAAIRRETPPRCVLDGEIVLATKLGLDFEALQERIHPAASRVNMLAEKTPAQFVAFDLLALGEDDYMSRPFSQRRAALESSLTADGTSVHLTPGTRDKAEAEVWFRQFEGAGLDGLIAKPLDGAYLPDKRVMFKLKPVRTADCVVAGYRLYRNDTDAIGSLLLGLYTEDGNLSSVGVIGAFPMATRRALFVELQSLVTDFSDHPWNWAQPSESTQLPQGTRTPQSGAGSRWNNGKDLSFVPLRPERVVEVRYDHMEGTRFRHTAQFNRWRPDRDPHSCTYEQLDKPVPFDLADIVPGLGSA